MQSFGRRVQFIYICVGWLYSGYKCRCKALSILYQSEYGRDIWSRESREAMRIFEMSEIKLERLNAFLVCLTHFLLWRMGGTRSPFPSSSWWRFSWVLFDVRWRSVKFVPGTGQGGQYKFCKSDELNQIVSLIFNVIKMKRNAFHQRL